MKLRESDPRMVVCYGLALWIMMGLVATGLVIVHFWR